MQILVQILVIQLCQVHAYVSVFNHDLDILISFLNFHRLFHPETTVEVIFFMNIFSYALRYHAGRTVVVCRLRPRNIPCS